MISSRSLTLSVPALFAALTLLVALPAAADADPTTAKVAKAKKVKRGKRGKRGPQGPAGATGTQGAPGVPGPLLETLPVGRTERGVFAGGYTATAAGAFGYAPISFPIPTAAAPVPNLIGPGAPPTPACPGSVSEPLAASGNFCAYVQSEANLDPINTRLCDVILNKCTGMSRFGGAIEFTAKTTSVYLIQGTWAVTG